MKYILFYSNIIDLQKELYIFTFLRKMTSISTGTFTLIDVKLRKIRTDSHHCT